jgi:hypothetical protein
MKNVLAMILVATMVSTVGAAPSQNAAFNVPASGAITVDGNLSDWTSSTPWSDPFVPWAGTGPATTSMTQAKFTWNQAADMLYVAYKTDEASAQPGGHPVIGISQTIDGSPYTAVGATQLAFDIAGSSVNIINEIDYYNTKFSIGWAGGGTNGVQAAYSLSGGVYTYEFAIPLWDNWAAMTTKKTLTPGSTVYMYGVVEDKLEGGNGTDMTYAGNPGFYAGLNGNGAALTLTVPEPATMALLGSGALTLLGLGVRRIWRRKR